MFLNYLQDSDQVAGLQAFTQIWGNIEIADIMIWSSVIREIREQYAKYSTLRIDIRNRGSERNNIIECSVIPEPAFLRRPGWLANGITIESAAGKMTVILQCQGNGELEVARGKTDGVSILLYDYKKQKIINHELFDVEFCNLSNKDSKWTFKVPKENSDYSLLVYAGVAGKTKDAGIEYKGIEVTLLDE